MTEDHFWDLLSKKLSGEASNAELKDLEEMQLNNIEWKTLADTLSLIWQQSFTTEDPEALKAFTIHMQRIKKAGIQFEEPLPDFTETKKEAKRYWVRRWWIAATAIAAATVIFLFLKPGHQYSITPASKLFLSQVTTKAGSRTQMQLPDGSSVWLNASSSLTYNENFGKNLREVNLSGEAFFDVVKDPNHPFIIHTKTIDVKVLGTKFNVKAYPDEAYTETSLLRGSVEVTIKNRPSEKRFLKPNEKILVANDLVFPEPARKETIAKPFVSIQHLNYYHADSTIIETSWVDNKLVFQENETFREVAMKMERWYGVHMIFADKKVAGYRLYGSFTKETITQALDALKEGFEFNYKINENDIIITQ